MAYLGSAPNVTDFASKTYTGDGSTYQFNIDNPAPSKSSLIVKLDGVVQNLASYSLASAGSQVDFGSGFAPATGVVVEIIQLGVTGSSTVPASGSVTPSHLDTSGVADGSKVLRDDFAWVAVEGSAISSQNTFFKNPIRVEATQTTTIAATERAALIGPVEIGSTSTTVVWTLNGELTLV